MSEPPQTVPTSLAPRSGQVKKTLAIWTVLIAMWSLIYLDTSPSWRPLVAIFVVGVLVTATVIATVGARRRARQFIIENTDAVAALSRGDVAIARATFWRWAETTSSPRISAIARHNLGWTLVRQGEHRQALAVFTDNEDRNARSLKEVALSATSAVDIALAHALLGDRDSAETWMAAVEQRAGEMTQASVPGIKAFARAVLACRAGDPAEAARVLGDRWAEYEAILTGENLRPMRVVRAFAMASGGPRNAGQVEVTIATARAVYPGEYDFLAVAWPEMQQFLDAHQLR